jgi:hypothetical protein
MTDPPKACQPILCPPFETITFHEVTPGVPGEFGVAAWHAMNGPVPDGVNPRHVMIVFQPPDRLDIPVYPTTPEQAATWAYRYGTWFIYHGFEDISDFEDQTTRIMIERGWATIVTPEETT